METKPNNFNQSILKAFKLLAAFTSEKKEWGVRELALKSGYNKSTTYRLLHTLASLDVVQQNDNEKYSLGSRLFELGNRVPLYQSLINATKLPIRDIAADIEETVLFGILKDNQVFYISKAESIQGLKISTSIDSYQPLHATAIGKVLLTYCSEAQRNNAINNLIFQPYTKNTITQKKVLLQSIEEVKAQGYALDMEEFEMGLICVAIPIFNKKNTFIGSISASGPLSRFEQNKVQNYISILQNGAQKINL